MGNTSGKDRRLRAMPRLPQPGGDADAWGTILNDYLSQAHDTDGSLKTGAVTTVSIRDDTITPAKLSAGTPGAGQVLSYDGSGFSWTTPSPGVTDHTQLANIGTNSHAQIDAHIASTANPHAVTKAQIGLGNVDNTSDASKPLSDLAKTYVNSRSSGLVTNGSGLLGDNTNFSAMTFSASDKPTGANGSFMGPLGSTGFIAQSDELISLSPAKYYELTMDARQVTGSARAYLFVAPYDVAGLTIQPYNYMAQPGTLTTLAAPLNPGDTTMTLTSSSGWNNAAGGATYHRAAIFWDYVDSKGYAWPVNTYSRNYTGSNFYADGAISGNVITLNAPYAGVAHPAGTSVSNGSSGSSYMYMATNALLTSTWTNYGGRFGGGVHAGGGMAAATTQLPMATSYVKVGVLLNYNIVTGPTQQAVANISLTEVEGGYAKFIGPATTTKQFTLPDASATILTSSAPVTVAQGGTGAATLTGILRGNGTSAVTAVTAPGGAIVGTTDAQTLTNKTISGVNNAMSDIPQSAVTGLTLDLAAKGARVGACYAAGKYINGLLTGQGAANSAGFIPDRAVAHLFYFPFEATIDGFGCYVGTAGAGATLRFALCTDSGNGIPADVALTHSGTIDGSTTGGKEIGTGPVTIPAGMYWAVVQTGVASCITRSAGLEQFFNLGRGSVADVAASVALAAPRVDAELAGSLASLAWVQSTGTVPHGIWAKTA